MHPSIPLPIHTRPFFTQDPAILNLINVRNGSVRIALLVRTLVLDIFVTLANLGFPTLNTGANIAFNPLGYSSLQSMGIAVSSPLSHGCCHDVRLQVLALEGTK